jgi:plasmid stabilization system protein ParE
MALKVVWTKQAILGFDRLIQYLSIHFSDREVRRFVKETNSLVQLLAEYPELLQQTHVHKNLRRGPINKKTVLTYRFRPRKGVIEIINIRPARQVR